MSSANRHHQSPSTEDITVPKDSEFFISIAKHGKHTFVILGVVDGDGTPTILTRIGKSNWMDKDFNNPFFFLKVLFGTTGGLVINEKNCHYNNYKVSYIAHQISYKQLKEMYRLLDNKIQPQGTPERLTKAHNAEALQNKYHWDYYRPVEETSNNITFRHRYDSGPVIQAVAFDDKRTRQAELVLKNTNKHNIHTTCRNTAIDLSEFATGERSKLISPAYFKSLPLTATYKGNSIDAPFYILPPPPPRNGSKQSQVLQRMYANLERMMQLSPDRPTAMKKFSAAKSLYLSMHNLNDMSVNELLNEIVHWHNTHTQLIDSSRRAFWGNFFQPTKTRQMLRDCTAILTSQSSPAP